MGQSLAQRLISGSTLCPMRSVDSTQFLGNLRLILAKQDAPRDAPNSILGSRVHGTREAGVNVMLAIRTGVAHDTTRGLARDFPCGAYEYEVVC